MTRSEIRQQILNALNTENWAKLQNSLVGRELISFATEVIAASNDINDSIISAFDYQTADRNQLISIARTWDVPISFNKPAFVRLTLTQPIYCAPFMLQFSTGNVRFYNIDYVAGTDVVLYQGIPKMAVESSEFPATNYSPFPTTNVTQVNWDGITLQVGPNESIAGLDLGNCVPESVYARYKRGNTVAFLSQFSPVRYFSEIPAYKLYPLDNGNTLFMQGNGVWALKPVEDGGTVNYRRQVFWLEPTNLEFSNTGTLTYREQDLGFTFKASGDAEFDSLQYAREYIRKMFVKLNGITSEQQIKDYVNGFSYIQDCAVEASNNLINVYVKPTDQNDLGKFGAIEADLDMQGTVSTTHHVIKGTAVYFQFRFDNIDDSLVPGMDDYLRRKYNYSVLPYDAIVDITELTSDIQKTFGVLAVIHMVVQPSVFESGSYLALIPNRGTVKTLTSDGVCIGYDINGQLLQSTVISDSALAPAIPFSKFKTALGAYSINNTDKVFYSFVATANAVYLKRASIKAIQNVLGEQFEVFTNSGYAFAYVNDNTLNQAKVAIYTSESLTQAGLNSNVAPITNDVKLMQKLDPNSGNQVTPVFIKGTLMTVERRAGVGIILSFFTGVSATPYYEYSTIPVDEAILGVYSDDVSVYIFTTNKIIQVNNINTNLMGYRLLTTPPGLSGSIVAVNAFSKNHIVVLTKNNATLTANVLSAIYSSASDCIFDVIATVQLNTTSSDTSFSVADLGDGFIVTGSTFMEYCSLNTATVQHFVQTNESSNKLPCIDESTMAAVGTINYDTGLMISQTGLTLSYDSDKIVRSKNQFIVLYTEHPIV